MTLESKQHLSLRKDYEAPVRPWVIAVLGISPVPRAHARPENFTSPLIDVDRLYFASSERGANRRFSAVVKSEGLPSGRVITNTRSSSDC